jgi:DNA-binding PadR family transcriptional regulator
MVPMDARERVLRADRVNAVLSGVRAARGKAKSLQLAMQLEALSGRLCSQTIWCALIDELVSEPNPTARLVSSDHRGRLVLTKLGDIREREYLRFKHAPPAFFSQDTARPMNPWSTEATMNELITLAIIDSFDQQPWSGPIADEFIRRTGREIREPTLQSLLKRLQERGLIEAERSRLVSGRGGKPRLRFDITRAGQNLLADVAALLVREPDVAAAELAAVKKEP